MFVTRRSDSSMPIHVFPTGCAYEAAIASASCESTRTRYNRIGGPCAANSRVPVLEHFPRSSVQPDGICLSTTQLTWFPAAPSFCQTEVRGHNPAIVSSGGGEQMFGLGHRCETSQPVPSRAVTICKLVASPCLLNKQTASARAFAVHTRW